MEASNSNEPPASVSFRQHPFQYLLNEATFYRISLTAFTLVPLLVSGIFYGCNGRFHIAYIDCLFLCYSAMTVTGLSTINLSTLTAWQQVILYLLMAIGDITLSSWIMVLVRKHYFRKEVLQREESNTKARNILQRSRTTLSNLISSPTSPRPFWQGVDKPTPTQITPEKPSPGFNLAIERPTPGATLLAEISSPPGDNNNPILGESDARTFSSSPRAISIGLPSPTGNNAPHFARGVEFTTHRTTDSLTHRRNFVSREHVPFRRATTVLSGNRLPPRRGNTAHLDVDSAKYTNNGGFVGPVHLAKNALKYVLPSTYKKLERKLTLATTVTLTGGGDQDSSADKKKVVNYIREALNLQVDRNSFFRTDELSDEELEEIGGTEYKALRLLSYAVPAYFILTQLAVFALFSPWIATTSTYDEVFANQPRLVDKTWFSLFQVMGAYTGGGLSLVDMGMVPFQTAYLMIFGLMLVILAGNHALPIFMRLFIWIASKLVTKNSDNHKTLSFLLDHPRRCFIYMFPAHQTWFLVLCLVLFSVVEWISFEILNIGLPIYEGLGPGPRIVTGLFQGLAARASGFSIISVSALAPALQFMYVVMMYIAVYPVAMSIRATNVYEERSLGVFEPEEGDDDEEEVDQALAKLPARERLGKYVSWHLERQLANDIWWLVFAVFAVAIIERHNLLDEDKKWFDLFRVLFELVSAFGGIGLTLGLPSDNYSFAGAMRPLSKIVIIVIMSVQIILAYTKHPIDRANRVRGRHRGLPVAVDRAILLPQELAPQPQPPGLEAIKEEAQEVQLDTAQV